MSTARTIIRGRRGRAPLVCWRRCARLEGDRQGVPLGGRPDDARQDDSASHPPKRGRNHNRAWGEILVYAEGREHRVGHMVLRWLRDDAHAFMVTSEAHYSSCRPLEAARSSTGTQANPRLTRPTF